MSDQPPPYPGMNEKAGYPPQQGSYQQHQGQYPPPQGQYPPPQGQYPPPQGQYPPQQGQYPPPQGHYPPPQGQNPPPPAQSTTNTVVVTQPVVFNTAFLGVSVRTVCPHCQAQVQTATRHETGTFTWVACCILCFIGCDAGCCLIPFCMDGCQDVVHMCPNCNQQIAKWSRL